MRVEETKIAGVLRIRPDVFEDHRGYYIETYNLADYVHEGIPQIWVQDDVSISGRHVLRGIHGDQRTWKLVSCVYGLIELAVRDYRADSPTLGQHQLFRLSGDDQYQQILVPPGCGNGHLVLSHNAVFHYKQSHYYDPKSQFTVSWNTIPWSLPHGVKPILSGRDGRNG